MRNKTIKLLCILLAIVLAGCKRQTPTVETPAMHTPVTVITVTNGSMSDSISLNATASFLKKNIIKSSATGYVRQVNVKIGDYVEQGQILFIIQTKEASVYNSKALDSLLNFNGQFQIRASRSGIVSQVDKQTDDYVTDGDQLCIISQKNSLVFLLNAPYEFNKFIHIKSPCSIELPDATVISGLIDSKLSSVDAASQMESFIVKPLSEKMVPENLIVRIHILKEIKKNSTVIPKQAVLTDEIEEHYWVMKLINDSTAVKVPITKGLETENSIEIITPKFTLQDRIVITGQYGLPDTASIEITKAPIHE